MPFAPQWLSLIQPVHVIVLFSAKVARLIAATITASRPHMLMALFMFTSLLRDKTAPGEWPGGQLLLHRYAMHAKSGLVKSSENLFDAPGWAQTYLYSKDS